MLKIKKSPSRIDKISNPREIAKFNMNIDAELLQKFKIKTITKGTSMTEVIVDMIQDYVKTP
jgi:hypothetical protein